MKFSARLYTHSILIMWLVSLFSCGLLGPDQGEKERETPDQPQPGSKKPKSKPAHIVDTGKLGAICKTVVDEIVKQKGPGGPFKLMSEFKDRFLDSHNNIRKRYNQKPLIWDDDIAAYAQRWADHLKKTNQCKMKHRSEADKTKERRWGENLAVSWTKAIVPPNTFIFSPESVVWNWSGECKDYSYEDTSCTPGEQCGHFTQVVWADTERVGCGLALCNGAETFEGKGRAEIYVCNYDPPGNIIDWTGTKFKPL